jgi:outer membrane protein assembly factor BamB
LATGKTIWEESVSVKMLAKQQYFGGSPMQPQTTPCYADGRLFTIGFTGLLHARDAKTGRLLWQADLVADFGATPVQFGFAASPIVVDGRLIVHVGGRHAVIALDPSMGKVLWKSEAGEPSYATPTIVTLFGNSQIVQLTRDRLLGLEIRTGSTIWSYDLPKKGMTNVPQPIPVGANGFIVSGQGFEGTRRLELVENESRIVVKERSHQKKVQFFYSTVVRDGDTVVGFSGNTGKRFAAVSIKTGDVVAFETGQTDANALRIGDRLLLARGDGVLSSCTLGQDGFENVRAGKFVSGRCWAPPTVVGGSVLMRSDSEIACMPLASLKADFKIPADSGRTAMDDAFGPNK